MEKPNPYHPLKLGNLELEGNLLLAPLAGYTDRAFRSLALDFGANLSFTEMVSCEAIARKNPKTLPLLERAEGENRLAIQIFSGSLDSLERSLEGLVTFHPDLIDLNCGCPVPKVVKTGAGSALMRNPDLIYRMIKVMAGTGRPVSAKIRSGWDHHSQNFLEAAQAACEGGAVMVTLHPRTRSQGYSGRSDWEQLKILKQALAIPVIGSGDLFTAADARDMLEQTGIDGVMFARGTLGHPFIFRETRQLLQTGTAAEDPTPLEKILAAERHFERSLLYLGECRTVKEIRKHLCAYTRGLAGSSELRRRLVAYTDRESYRREFRKLREWAADKDI